MVGPRCESEQGEQGCETRGARETRETSECVRVIPKRGSCTGSARADLTIYRANLVIYLKKDICYMLMQPSVHELAVRLSILVILWHERGNSLHLTAGDHARDMLLFFYSGCP